MSETTIQLGTTVYGADINWVTGMMTVKWAIQVFTGGADENWYGNSSWNNHSFVLANALSDAVSVSGYTTVADIASNFGRAEAPADLVTTNLTTVKHGVGQGDGRSLYVNIKDDLDTSTKFKNYLASNPLQIEYKLATPTTIQLTPEQLEMLKGYNRVTIEDGSIELGYIAKLT